MKYEKVDLLWLISVVFNLIAVLIYGDYVAGYYANLFLLIITMLVVGKLQGEK